MPAFNEEEILEEAVGISVQTFEQLRLDFEIIIIDDGSTDATGAIADRLAEENECVRVVHHDVNQGLGGGVRTGVMHASMEYVIFIPADNALQPEEMAPFIRRMGTCDIIVGVREKRVGYPPIAHLGSFVFNRIFMPLLFNLGITDVNWIQMYRTKIFTEEGVVIEYGGIFFTAAILIQARRKRLLIAEVPANMRKRVTGNATCFRWTNIWKTFRDMVGLYLDSSRYKP